MSFLVLSPVFLSNAFWHKATFTAAANTRDS